MILKQIKPSETTCAVDGCEKRRYCRGFCTMHYYRVRRHGAPGNPKPIKAASGMGSVHTDGYRIVHRPGHPMAKAQGKALEHRVVLFDAIGEGPHPCRWCGKELTWHGRASERICADHLDFNRLNNVPENLVPSCLDCNTKRRPA